MKKGHNASLGVVLSVSVFVVLAVLALKGYTFDDLIDFSNGLGFSSLDLLKTSAVVINPTTTLARQTTTSTIHFIATTSVPQQTTIPTTSIIPTSTLAATTSTSTTTTSTLAATTTTTILATTTTTLASTSTTSTLPSPLKILLDFPPHGFISHEKNMTFGYTPESDARIRNCSLYLSKNGDWALAGVDTTIFNETVNTFYLSDLSIGVYGWNVRCADEAGRQADYLVNYTFLAA